jgi:hypothetical protein
MLDDTMLWKQFTESTLPREEWTHTAHLRLAWMLLCQHSLDEAHLRLRIGIIKLNASHGLVESTTRGYHETMTRVWLALVSAAMRLAPGGADSSAFLAAQAGRLGKNAPLSYYSRERLLGISARARFVEPDLAPLP